MKKLLVITLFIATTVLAIGQDKTVAYLSFAPGDNGLGLRVDIDGGYMSMSYGNYWLPYGGYIKDHTKIALGVIYKDFTLGVSYHQWGEVNETLPLTKRTLRPMSMELGARVTVIKGFVAALRYDILRGEGTVDFGWRF